MAENKTQENAAAELAALKAREAQIKTKMESGLSREQAEAAIDAQAAYDKALAEKAKASKK